MIAVMVEVRGSLADAIRDGADFFIKRYTVLPVELWHHLSLQEVTLPDGMNLIIKAERFVYHPRIIYVVGEGDGYVGLCGKADFN